MRIVLGARRDDEFSGSGDLIALSANPHCHRHSFCKPLLYLRRRGPIFGCGLWQAMSATLSSVKQEACGEVTKEFWQANVGATKNKHVKC